MQIKVNGKIKQAKPGSSILEACRYQGIYVPSLCYHPDTSTVGHCGLCRVKVDGHAYVYACMTEIEEGMNIDTKADDVIAQAKAALDQILDLSFPPCSKELEDLYNYLYPIRHNRARSDERTASLVFEPKTCIACKRCISMCADVMGINALDNDSISLRQSTCISCGQCTMICPTESMKETPSTAHVLKAIGSGKILILIVSVASRVSIGEFLGDQIGQNGTGKVIAAARQLGFKYIFDGGVGEDFTLMQTADELHRRKVEGDQLPLLSSSCPSFINLVEKIHPQIRNHVMALKSPYCGLDRLIRTKIAHQRRIRPQNLYIVHLSTCVCAKSDIYRMQCSGDIDASLTSREFASLVRLFGIEWLTLEPLPFDAPWSDCSSSAILTAVTVGLTEGIIRSLQESAHVALAPIDIQGKLAQGNPVTSITATVDSTEYRFAICHAAGARHLIASNNYQSYDFIEVMACPGGCVNGGGQRRGLSRADTAPRTETILRMAKAASVHPPALPPNAGFDTASRKLFETFFERQESSLFLARKRRELPGIVGFGSTHGRAVRHARLLAESLGVTSVAMNLLDSIQTLITRAYVVFVMSTDKNGYPPQNAALFIRNLSASTSESLRGLSFAVLGLGDSTWESGARVAGQPLYHLLTAHGAIPKLPLTIADTAARDGGESTFIEFAGELASALFLPPPKIGFENIIEVGVVSGSIPPDKLPLPLPDGFEPAEVVDRSFLSPP
jgi:iron only hydrogenase large subunit-like protein/ferredoxin